MSVKIKIIIGFILILLMVSIQSILIIYLNDQKDKISTEIVSLYQLNNTVKDRLTDVNNFERDLFFRIINNEAIAKSDSNDTLSCFYLNRNLQQWYNAFTNSQDFLKLDDARKQIIYDFKGELDTLSEAMAQIRDLPTFRKNDRLSLFNSAIKPSVAQINNLTKDFVGLNSFIFAKKNQNMLDYSDSIRDYQIIIISAAMMIILFIIFYSNHLLKPLNWLMDGVRHITKGELNFKIRKRSNDELGKLAEHMNIMSDEIRNHRDHLEDLVQKRTMQLLDAKEELEKINNNLIITNKNLEDARRMMELDMKMAINVQSSFFMKDPPEVSGWDISFYFKPMSGVSGDMYDFYVDNNFLRGMSLMDVSGHGVASGLVTMIAKSIAFRTFQSGQTLPLNQIMKDINEELIQEIGNIDNYLTGIMLKFDEHLVHYVNAGHTELLKRSRHDGETTVVKLENDPEYKGMFLGLEVMKTDFKQLSFKVDPGDVILAYSDCLIESSSPDNVDFGLDSTIDSLNTAPKGTAKEILEHIINRLLLHTQSDRFEDDLTVICLRKI